mgnify:CR=1 FL=1|tara:strand:+ start:135 stop:500 length:366 start_codon:yes stop_codon:yes gene_type:complete
METQPTSINLSQAWYGGTENACSLYTTFCKIEKKYIVPITRDIKEISKELLGKRIFKVKPQACKFKIKSIISKIDSFNLDELEILLEKNYTTIDFLCKVNNMRERNTKEHSIKIGRKISNT